MSEILMSVIICGGRDYQITEEGYAFLDWQHRFYQFEEVVSGGASGADKCGEEWARRNGVPVRRFNADWEKYGKKAGPMRNKQMAKYADMCIAFPGGAGTESMKRLARGYGLVVIEFRDSGEVK